MTRPGKRLLILKHCRPAGVGKTISAVEFSYRASEDYDGVFWLQADTTPGLAESYIQMTDVLQISMTLDDQKRAIDRGLEWLTNTCLVPYLSLSLNPH